jgi:hypothetical protein
MLVYYMALWSNFRPFGIHIIWLFGIFCDHFGMFSPFWYIVPKTIWQPCMPTVSTDFSRNFANLELWKQSEKMS